MSGPEELPTDQVTSERRSGLLWLIVLAGAALAAYLLLGIREGQCVDGPDVSACTSYIPNYAIAGAVLAAIVGVAALRKLIRRG
jgi:hypothetical protein